MNISQTKTIHFFFNHGNIPRISLFLIGILLLGCSDADSGQTRVDEILDSDSLSSDNISADNDIPPTDDVTLQTDDSTSDEIPDAVDETDDEVPSPDTEETIGDSDLPDTDADTDIDNGIIISFPPANAKFDYQLGGPYPPPDGVLVLARDSTAPPVIGLYNICYVNGFQTQPDDADWWTSQHPDLILRDSHGNPVIDPDWPDEMLLDITTPEKRSAISSIIGEWIVQCALDGYQAVEMDNLDTYSRSGGRIDIEDAVAMVRLFAETAHAAGLAIAQKNAVELSARRAETLLDFVVAEECNQYNECGDYTAYYGDLVFVIEYRQSAFQKGCSAFPHLSIILRDIMLVTPNDPGYLYDAC